MRITAADAQLKIDKDKCTKCGICTHICWTHAMVKDAEGYPVMNQVDLSDTWHSCWACQRCMAVCPTGALSICGKDPEDSVPASAKPAPEEVDALVLNRRTCRDYKDEDVEQEVLDHILKMAGTAPSGGCNQEVEFTVFSNKESFAKFKIWCWNKVCEKAEQGIYPGRFSELDFKLVKKGMDKGKDNVFRGAPNLLIIHAPTDKGDWETDCAISMSYAELLMNAYDLGTVVASFLWASMNTIPEVKEKLGIPADHYVGCPLLFGKPSIPFPRGVQRFDHLQLHKISL